MAERGVTGRPRVAAVISGALVSSSRFRVLQHVAPLRALGIDVTARPPRIAKYTRVDRTKARGPIRSFAASSSLTAGKLAARAPEVARSWRADVTWLEREMLPGRATLEPLLHRPLVFDVDDAIWLLSSRHERAARAIGARSACVIAGNDYIAEWFASCASSVARVWTGIDTERYTPASPRDDDRFVIGWTGSGSTLRHLFAIAPALTRFLAQAPDARLVVMADVAPEFLDLPPDRFTFVPWSPAREAAVVRDFDVGLMPLPDTDWARGKCAYKMLQYSACGIPAIASPVGMNAQLLDMAEIALPAADDGDWIDALHTLRSDRCHARAMGARGRALVEANFSLAVIAAQLADVFRSVQGA